MADDVLLTSPKNTIQKLKWIDDGVGGYWAPVVWNANGGGGGGGGGGDASAANQVTGNNSLASIDGKTSTVIAGLASIDGHVDGLETLGAAGNTSLSSIDSKTPALSGGAVPVVAAALPLPTGAATSAAQGTGNTSLSSIDGKLPALSGGAVPVVMSATPTGAATAANQGTANTSLASIDTKLTGVATAANQATGNTSLGTLATNLPAKGASASAAAMPVALATDDAQIGVKITAISALPTGGSGLMGWLSRIYGQFITQLPAALGSAAKAASLPVVLPTDPDTRPAAGTITVQDTASASAVSTPVTGSATVSSITGAPSPNSFLTTAINGQELARTQVTGTWTGTLVFEVSIDGGTTYQSAASHISGTTFETSSIIGNGQFITLVAGATHFRVRASTAITGTANVQTTYTQSGGIVKVNSGTIYTRFSNAQSLISISGTITAGGTAQNAVAANLSRLGFALQNNSAGDLWFNTLAAAVIGQPSMKLSPGDYYETPPGGCGTGAISVIGATTAQAFTGREW